MFFFSITFYFCSMTNSIVQYLSEIHYASDTYLLMHISIRLSQKHDPALAKSSSLDKWRNIFFPKYLFWLWSF